MDADFQRLGWFFLRRMAFLGTICGCCLGAVYGLLLGFGTPPAGLIGIIFGTPVGLLLGVVNGLVLYGMARVFDRLPRSEIFFREVAGGACLLTSAALACTAFSVMSSGSLGPTPDSFDITILIIVPTIVAMAAMWILARRVAGSYARHPEYLDL